MKTLAIITGHSRGLGAGLTQACLEQGIPVWGLSRTAASKATTQVAYPHEARLEQTRMDLADGPSLLALLDSDLWSSKLKSADQVLLINNAALLSPIGPVGSQRPADVLEAVTVNVAAALLLANAFVQASSPQADRRLVHISSGAARSAYAGWNVYCATKAALDQHARAMALEQHGRPNPVRVSSIAPGVIDTEMQAQVRASALTSFPMRPKFEDLKASGALQKPDDAARTLLTYVRSPQFGMEVVTDLRSIVHG